MKSEFRGLLPPKLSAKNDLEQAFLTLFGMFRTDSADPVRQLKFHPKRRWRFDFAWTAELVAVEIQGGIFVRGGHSRGVGYSKDCDKANAAAEMGWYVLRYTVLHIENDPVSMIQQIERVLRQRAK